MTKQTISLFIIINVTGVEDSNGWMGHWGKKSEGSPTSVFLVVVIISAPGNSEQRDVMRQTWLRDEALDTHHYFVIGTAGVTEELNTTIQSEQKRFGDLMLLNNIYDSYEALTKKLLASLVYIHKNVKFR